MEVISKQIVTKSGYLHLCRVSGDLYESYAIEDSAELAEARAVYGQENERVTDRSIGYGTYKVTDATYNRNGWTVREETVRDSNGIIICSRQF